MPKKKAKIAKKNYSVKVGKTVKIKVKNSVKKAKITWKAAKKPGKIKFGKKKNGKNAYAIVKGVKKGKVKVTATYKVGKKKTKLTCTVNVKAANPAPTAAPIVAPTAVPVVPTPVPTPTPEPFTILHLSFFTSLFSIILLAFSSTE